MNPTPSLIRCLVLVLVLTLTACAAPTAAIVPTAAPATDLPATVAPSATPQPSATAQPTATAEPSATPAPPTATATPQPTFGAAEDGGLTAFCLPEDSVLAQMTDVLNPPDYAVYGEVVDGALEVNNLPALACTFLYSFNSPVPEGLTLEAYELNATSPWLTAALEPVAGDPNTAAAILRHTYIVAPPLWNVSFEFAVKDAQGSELRRDPVNLHRWVPALCFNGQPPDINTLRCPLWQDLHPWDAGYGTVIPTFTLSPED